MIYYQMHVFDHLSIYWTNLSSLLLFIITFIFLSSLYQIARLVFQGFFWSLIPFFGLSWSNFFCSFSFNIIIVDF